MRWRKKQQKGSKRKSIVVLMISSVLLAAMPTVGAPNWAIYADANIEEDDQYNIVEVHDSLTVPPVQTTVTMTGGLVNSLGAFDSSIVNVSGGNLNYLGSYDTGTINIYGGVVAELLWLRDSSTANLYGGIATIIEVSYSASMNLRGGIVDEYIYASGEPSLAINIYGTDFFYDSLAGNYGGGRLSGNWPGGTAFSIDFYATDAPGGPPIDSYSYVHLHIIPEPSSFLLFGLILVFGRKLNRR